MTNTLSDVRLDLEPCVLAVTPLVGAAGFAVRGEIDESNRWALAAVLREAVARGGDVHLEMSGVEFADVGTAALLVEAAQQLRPRGQLLVHHPPYELSFLLCMLWPGTASIEADEQ